MKRERAFESVLSVLCSNLDMKRGMILLYDNVSKNLYIEASVGLNNDLKNNIRYKVGEGIVGKVFKIGMPIMIPNISDDPDLVHKFDKNYDEVFSLLAVPIKEGEDIYGVMAVDKNVLDVVSYANDMDILKMISSLLASYKKKIELFEMEKRELEDEKSRLQSEVKKKYNFRGLVGISKGMQHIFETIKVVSDTRSTILLRGESGTGKEIVAKTIHYNSNRVNKPFIAVNCAAIPGELVESELFGYEKGAFTGAVSGKKGKFELADEGTIFLDEIGDMPLAAQSKLLRILQERKVERLGSIRDKKIDVRVIAASNKNIEEETKNGHFRFDLYYRLNVVSIFLPPLRKRKEDIPLLANYILRKFNKEYGKNLSFSDAAMKILLNCNFPGNIRELENCIERAVLFANDSVIERGHISCVRESFCSSHVLEEMIDYNGDNSSKNKVNAISNDKLNNDELPPREIGENEEKNKVYNDKDLVITALEDAGWVQAKAARLLNMTVRQMNYRIKKYNINMRKF